MAWTSWDIAIATGGARPLVEVPEVRPRALEPPLHEVQELLRYKEPQGPEHEWATTTGPQCTCRAGSVGSGQAFQGAMGAVVHSLERKEYVTFINLNFTYLLDPNVAADP